GDIALSFVGNRNDGLQLQWVTDGDDAFGSPNRSGSVLWRSLPGLVDEKPPKRFSPEITEHPPGRGERRRHQGDCKEKELPGCKNFFGFKFRGVVAAYDCHRGAKSTAHLPAGCDHEVLMELQCF